MSGGQLATELDGTRLETRVLFVSGYAGQTMLDHRVGDVDYNFLQKAFTLTQWAKQSQGDARLRSEFRSSTPGRDRQTSLVV
jgi:hypothetical protein